MNDREIVTAIDRLTWVLQDVRAELASHNDNLERIANSLSDMASYEERVLTEAANFIEEADKRFRRRTR